MNRRDLLTRMGSMGAALTVGGAACAAESEHGGSGGAPAHGAGPLGNAHAHFCGIHVAKHDPSFQLVVQHFCAAHSGETEEDQLFQCILFDSSKANAKLIGIEYIISDQKYRSLPEAEKSFWHPHTYEVLGGGLIAPGMSAEDEEKFMKGILTTWGKTWHTWPDSKTDVPLGEPMLIWSLGADGQVDETLAASRDREFGVSTTEIRTRRAKLFGLEVPNVKFPASRETLGRQWTNDGEDKPVSR